MVGVTLFVSRHVAASGRAAKPLIATSTELRATSSSTRPGRRRSRPLSAIGPAAGIRLMPVLAASLAVASAALGLRSSSACQSALLICACTHSLNAT
jgi:hypothetical protein